MENVAAAGDSAKSKTADGKGPSIILNVVATVPAPESVPYHQCGGFGQRCMDGLEQDYALPPVLWEGISATIGGLPAMATDFVNRLYAVLETIGGDDLHVR